VLSKAADQRSPHRQSKAPGPEAHLEQEVVLRLVRHGEAGKRGTSGCEQADALNQRWEPVNGERGQGRSQGVPQGTTTFSLQDRRDSFVSSPAPCIATAIQLINPIRAAIQHGRLSGRLGDQSHSLVIAARLGIALRCQGCTQSMQAPVRPQQGPPPTSREQQGGLAGVGPGFQPGQLTSNQLSSKSGVVCYPSSPRFRSTSACRHS
jgi:hypothetical protein